MARFASASRGPALLLAFAGLGALWDFPQCQAQTSPQPHAAFTARGVVEPADGILSIGTAATGVIERIGAEPGEVVHAGDELIKIDCAPLEADMKALAGQAQAAQAVDERVRNGSRRQEIAVGEANVGVAKARAEEAAEALRRAQALQLGISVTQAVMLQVERDARITTAQLEDARARLDLLRSGSREEDIAEADARRDAASAALEAARARLAQCTVRSPIDGVVLEQLASRGQFVTSAVPSVLLRVANDKNLGIRAEVEAAHLSDLCMHQRASIARPSGSAGELGASVTRIAPLIGALSPAAPRQGETAPNHADAFLTFDRPPTGLYAGEDVTVRFEPCGA
ncbi:MAG TPA: HlyD family efflux transporter periplasmic adaptor subunit [Beijerinckiaceae bacterium]|nr:HlyD family efflux transporter periplasmic adaptor subunit [Beijerinckiaceae bacterium]